MLQNCANLCEDSVECLNKATKKLENIKFFTDYPKKVFNLISESDLVEKKMNWFKQMLPFLLDLEDEIQNEITRMKIEISHLNQKIIEFDHKASTDKTDEKIKDLNERKKLLESIVSELALKLKNHTKNNVQGRELMEEIEEINQRCEIVKKRLQMPLENSKEDLSKNQILQKNLDFLGTLDYKSGKIHEFMDILKCKLNIDPNQKRILTNRVEALIRVLKGPKEAQEFRDSQ